jgi:hypothetical protein
MAHSKASATKIDAAQRRIQALNFRLQGLTYREIGEAMGFSEARAHKIVTTELRRLNDKRSELATEQRKLDAARLDTMLKTLWPAVLKGKPEVIDRALSIMQRRAKLYGLDAPTRQELGNLGGEPFKLYGGGFNPEVV